MTDSDVTAELVCRCQICGREGAELNSQNYVYLCTENTATCAETQEHIENLGSKIDRLRSQSTNYVKQRLVNELKSYAAEIERTIPKGE